jgi:hypothetical protein
VRYLRQLKGLKRTNTLTDEELDQLILAQKEALGGRMYIRLITQHLRTFCRAWAGRTQVAQSLHRVDPGGRKPKPPIRRKKAQNPSSGNTSIQVTDAQSDSVGAIPGSVSNDSMLLNDEGAQAATTIPDTSVLPGQVEPASADPTYPQGQLRELVSNNPYEQITILSADNRALQTEVEFLRAELARLAGNVHPYVDMSQQSNWAQEDALA